MRRNVMIGLCGTLTGGFAAMYVGQWSDADSLDHAGPPNLDAAQQRPAFVAHPIAGPDLITGAITNPQNWGGLGGVSAISLGHTKCNIGTSQVMVVQATNQHPVHASGIFRVAAGSYSRIEQLGQSWVWHNFCSLQEALCSSCQPCGAGCPPCLGAGCADPTPASLQGQQNRLGPRAEVNALTGAFPYPATAGTATGDVSFKRIQVANADLDPALNPGATYYGENTILSPQDAAAGNGTNNASHIKMLVGAFTGSAYNMSLSGATVQQLPVIHAWKTIDPSVTIVNVDVPGGGRFIVAHDVTDLGSGRWHYEYAVYNLNSHRSGEKFIIPLGPGVTISNEGFHDVDYHSQSVLPAAMQVDNLDWTVNTSAGQIEWATSPYSAGNEQTANALRWGTLYNFRFDADGPPIPATAVIDLFRPGSPDTVAVAVQGPSTPPRRCPADFDASGIVNGLDLAVLLATWGSCPRGDCITDLNGDDIINGLDLALLLANWGPC